jgi:hypothetical protein
VRLREEDVLGYVWVCFFFLVDGTVGGGEDSIGLIIPG